MSALQQIEIRIADRDVPFQASKIHADYYLLDKKSVDDAKAEIQKQRDQAVDKCFLADRDIKVLNQAGHAAADQLLILADAVRTIQAKNLETAGYVGFGPEVMNIANNAPTWSELVQRKWDGMRLPAEVQEAIDARYSGSHTPAEGGKKRKKDVEGQISIRDVPKEEQAEGGEVKQMTLEELAEYEQRLRDFSRVDSVEAWDALTAEERAAFKTDFDTLEAAAKANSKQAEELLDRIKQYAQDAYHVEWTKLSDDEKQTIMQAYADEHAEKVPEELSQGLQIIADRFASPVALIGCSDDDTVDAEVVEEKKLVDMTPAELATACGTDLSQVPVDFSGEDEDWHKLSDADKIDWLAKVWEEPQRNVEEQSEPDEPGKSTANADDAMNISETSDGTVPFAKPAGKDKKPGFGRTRSKAKAKK